METSRKHFMVVCYRCCSEGGAKTDLSRAWKRSIRV